MTRLSLRFASLPSLRAPVALGALVASLAAQAPSRAIAAPAAGRTLAPAPDTPECRDFVSFAVERAIDHRYPSSSRSDLAPFNTDGIVVQKNGRVVFEWYDGFVGPETPHVLWSASKMMTATLLARTIQEKASYRGQPITLETPISLFFPAPAFLSLRPEQRAAYERINLRHLVEMSANFEWKEYYDGDLGTSSFFPMLYGEGIGDVAAFALRTPLHRAGPDGRWNYSGGNVNVLSAILAKIHGSVYDEMPWKLLFEPLGIRDARVERDLSGVFIGSSYFYMSLRSMAKIGELYRSGGIAPNGRRLLPPGWTDEAKELSPAVLQPATDLDTIKKLGAFGRRMFWLNRPIYRADGAFADASGRRVLYPPEMPQLPSDFHFAGGHYGQVIALIPSQGLVIARTGYDASYWDHMQPLAAKALACFNPPWKPRMDVDLVPPSAGPRRSLVERAFKTATELPTWNRNILWAEENDVFERVLAKELCSFLFVSDGYAATQRRMLAESGQAPTEAEVSWRGLLEYLDRSGVPAIVRNASLVNDSVRILPSARTVVVEVGRDRPSGRMRGRIRAEAEADGRFGCRLTEQTHIVYPPEPSPLLDAGGGGA